MTHLAKALKFVIGDACQFAIHTSYGSSNR